jgi:NAD-dependent dihydropyrimidine dehydrogenase PreA subunit
VTNARDERGRSRSDDRERCQEDAGALAPVIDRRRCEGKEDCVRVCPYDVFDVRPLAPAERAGLPMLARLKLAFHGNRQAFAARADACRGCGLCVAACPERAIRLERATTSHPPPSAA